MSWGVAAGGRFKRNTEVHTPQDVTAAWNPVPNEMALSLCLCCHEAIQLMVCVVDTGTGTALDVLGQSQTREMLVGLLVVFSRSEGQGSSTDPGVSLGSLTPSCSPLPCRECKARHRQMKTPHPAFPFPLQHRHFSES